MHKNDGLEIHYKLFYTMRKCNITKISLIYYERVSKLIFSKSKEFYRQLFELLPAWHTITNTQFFPFFVKQQAINDCKGCWNFGN